MRLDLLLANAEDSTAIVGEVKIGTEKTADKDAFATLVQALACAAQLVCPAQYARLVKHATRERGDVKLRGLAGPAYLDLYLILHSFPDATYLGKLRDETERLSALLLAHPLVNPHVRRIACVLTEVVDDGIVAQRDFAFERPQPVG